MGVTLMRWVGAKRRFRHNPSTANRIHFLPVESNGTYVEYRKELCR